MFKIRIHAIMCIINRRLLYSFSDFSFDTDRIPWRIWDSEIVAFRGAKQLPEGEGKNSGQCLEIFGYLLDLHCIYSRDQLLVVMDYMTPGNVREGVK